MYYAVIYCNISLCKKHCITISADFLKYNSIKFFCSSIIVFLAVKSLKQSTTVILSQFFGLNQLY